jgi:hypothetical protein
MTGPDSKLADSGWFRTELQKISNGSKTVYFLQVSAS